MVGVGQSFFLSLQRFGLLYLGFREHRVPTAENSPLKVTSIVSRIVINYEQPT